MEVVGRLAASWRTFQQPLTVIWVCDVAGGDDWLIAQAEWGIQNAARTRRAHQELLAFSREIIARRTRPDVVIPAMQHA